MTINTTNMPDNNGYVGEYGGQILPPPMIDIMNQINDAYDEIAQTKTFQDELTKLYADYVDRPSPIYFARRLTDSIGGARKSHWRT